MKKLYKLTNLKLNQSFWVIVAAFVLQIITGVVMSLTLTNFSSSITGAAHIFGNQMFIQGSLVGQMTSAIVAAIGIGVLVSIFAIFRCDLKYYVFLGVNQKQNTVANIVVGAIISIVVALIFIISQVINLLVARTLDGYWLSAIADGETIGKLFYHALLCILATFTIYTLLITLKQLFVRSTRICILVSAAIIIFVLLFMFHVIDLRSLREVMFTKVGGVIALIISGAIFTTSYCSLAMIGEVKR